MSHAVSINCDKGESFGLYKMGAAATMPYCTVRLAKERGVRVGALRGFLDREGMPLSHIKPHGALYGMASRTESVAHAICGAAQVFGAALLGMAGTMQEAVHDAEAAAARTSEVHRAIEAYLS